MGISSFGWWNALTQRRRPSRPWRFFEMYDAKGVLIAPFVDILLHWSSLTQRANASDDPFTCPPYHSFSSSSIFDFCKHLRSQIFYGIYFVGDSVYKIGVRHSLRLASKKDENRVSALFRPCWHAVRREFSPQLRTMQNTPMNCWSSDCGGAEGGRSCASHSSPLEAEAIPNRLWP
jgi:hypothetical protein